MKEERSTSQVLYGFLPQQTVDLRGDVWKVTEWRNALRVQNIDDETLRRELQRLVLPWETAQNDNYLGRILRRNEAIRVVEVNPENGVEVEPFPKQWVCRVCKRLHGSADARCQCGNQALSSFHFVGYHDQCGALREVPLPPPCPQHSQRAVRFPGASQASELRFVCPVCDRTLRKGFPQNITCPCGKPGNITFNVHRAAAVFTPRTVVVVNAPKADQRVAIAAAGGRSRALSWMLDGMSGKVTEASATEESLRQTLRAQGMPDAVIEMMVTQARGAGALGSTAPVVLRAEVKDAAEDQAVTVALASLNSRQSQIDLQSLAPGMTARGALYRDRYSPAIAAAGLESVDLFDRFPILTGVFGYTRGDYAPGASALVPFKHKAGGVSIHADFAETEALYFRLDPVRVANWLVRRGRALPAFNDARSARLAILEVCAMPANMDRDGSIDQELFTLVHSYAHRAMRIGAKFAGIERSALAELLVPLHLGFFVYASPRGDFVLGGLQSVFESRLHDYLGAIVNDERRCPMDPGCGKASGACPACLHVGEPSCRWFNQLLDRRTLFGGSGYFRT